MKKKTATPKRKRKLIHNVEIEGVFEGQFQASSIPSRLPPIDYVAVTFLGRFILAGMFFRKAFACLFKGQATV